MTEKLESKKTSKALRGVVSRVSSEQTIKVSILVLKSHPKYRKVLKLTTVMTVHDEQNIAKPGDVVLIRPCKPYSKTKSWELAHIFPR